MLGASRKRMIGALSNEAPADARLGGSLALAMKGMDAGIQLLRVHDVAETVQAARVWRGLRDAALVGRSRMTSVAGATGGVPGLLTALLLWPWEGGPRTDGSSVG